MEEKKNLLDYALEHTLYSFISDLPNFLNKEQVVKIYSRIDIKAYTLKEWNETLSYLLGTTVFQKKETMEEIYGFLEREADKQHTDDM